MLPKGQGLDQFVAGQIQLLDIESVRTELGARWAKVEQQVHLVVEATLRHILTDQDIFTRIGDCEYLVIFPAMTEQKASALMFVAAAQIRQKLFGQDSALAAIRLNATVTRVSRDLIASADDPVAAVHDAALLLGQPAKPISDEPQDAPPMSPMALWGDQYEVVPIEGGGMTQGHIIVDPLRAGRPTPDFGAVADRPQAAGGPSGAPPSVPAGASGKPAQVAGYPVVPLSGASQREGRLVADAARPQTRLPDFSTVHEASRARTDSAAVPSAPGQGGAHSASPMKGYAVFPIKGGGMTTGHLVQDATRPQGRLPDFASPIVVPDVSQMGARLETLAAKATSFESIPITGHSAGSANPNLSPAVHMCKPSRSNSRNCAFHTNRSGTCAGRR